MVALGIIFLGLLAKSKKKLRGALILAMVLIVLVSVGGERFKERAASIFDDSKDEVGSRQTRVNLLETGLRAFWNSPFIGVGLGNFVNMEGTSWYMAHNGYIEIAVEHGIFGLVLYLGLLCSILFNLRRMQRLLSVKGTLLNEYYLCQFLEIDIWTYFVIVMFSTPFGWFFFYLLGFTISMRKWLASKIISE
jgi:O-antigen ligase